MKKRVAILKGGVSVEREVSLSTGQSCSKALIRLGYNVKSIDTKENFIEPIYAFVPSIGINQIIKVPNDFSKFWSCLKDL